MLNTLYGWYLKNKLSCVFDTLTFTEAMAANTTAEFNIANARYGDLKKLKLGTFNFIITRIFTASTGGIPLEVEVMPDGDLLDGFVSIVWTPREVEPTAPIVITMELKLDVVNAAGADSDLFMVFEGFWIPRSLMPRFDELADMVVTSWGRTDSDGIDRTREVAYPTAGPTAVSQAVPHCERRRF